METRGREDENIYDDLDFHLDEDMEKLKADNQMLEKNVHLLEDDVKKLKKVVIELKSTQVNLSNNISSLYLTAKTEIDRKNRMIADLQQKLDNIIFKRNSTEPKMRNSNVTNVNHLTEPKHTIEPKCNEKRPHTQVFDKKIDRRDHHKDRDRYSHNRGYDRRIVNEGRHIERRSENVRDQYNKKRIGQSFDEYEERHKIPRIQSNISNRKSDEDQQMRYLHNDLIRKRILNMDKTSETGKKNLKKKLKVVVNLEEQMKRKSFTPQNSFEEVYPERNNVMNLESTEIHADIDKENSCKLTKSDPLPIDKLKNTKFENTVEGTLEHIAIGKSETDLEKSSKCSEIDNLPNKNSKKEYLGLPKSIEFATADFESIDSEESFQISIDTGSNLEDGEILEASFHECLKIKNSKLLVQIPKLASKHSEIKDCNIPSTTSGNIEQKLSCVEKHKNLTKINNIENSGAINLSMLDTVEEKVTKYSDMKIILRQTLLHGDENINCPKTILDQDVYVSDSNNTKDRKITVLSDIVLTPTTNIKKNINFNEIKNTNVNFSDSEAEIVNTGSKNPCVIESEDFKDDTKDRNKQIEIDLSCTKDKINMCTDILKDAKTIKTPKVQKELCDGRNHEENDKTEDEKLKIDEIQQQTSAELSITGSENLKSVNKIEVEITKKSGTQKHGLLDSLKKLDDENTDMKESYSVIDNNLLDNMKSSSQKLESKSNNTDDREHKSLKCRETSVLEIMEIGTGESRPLEQVDEKSSRKKCTSEREKKHNKKSLTDKLETTSSKSKSLGKKDLKEAKGSSENRNHNSSDHKKSSAKSESASRKSKSHQKIGDEEVVKKRKRSSNRDENNLSEDCRKLKTVENVEQRNGSKDPIESNKQKSLEHATSNLKSPQQTQDEHTDKRQVESSHRDSSEKRRNSTSRTSGVLNSKAKNTEKAKESLKMNECSSTKNYKKSSEENENTSKIPNQIDHKKITKVNKQSSTEKKSATTTKKNKSIENKTSADKEIEHPKKKKSFEGIKESLIGNPEDTIKDYGNVTKRKRGSSGKYKVNSDTKENTSDNLFSNLSQVQTDSFNLAPKLETDKVTTECHEAPVNNAKDTSLTDNMKTTVKLHLDESALDGIENFDIKDKIHDAKPDKVEKEENNIINGESVLNSDKQEKLDKSGVADTGASKIPLEEKESATPTKPLIRRRITPTPVKDTKEICSFANILEKTQSSTPSLSNPLHLTHEGEIPILHIEENNFNAVPITDADNHFMNLLDTMHLSSMEFKSNSDNMEENVHLNKGEISSNFENIMDKINPNEMNNDPLKKTMEPEIVTITDSKCNTMGNLSLGSRKRRICSVIVLE